MSLIRTAKVKWGQIKAIFKIVNDPRLSETYYPDVERKSKPAILWENLLWLGKHREVNWNYFAYGLDRKSGLEDVEILSYSEFSRLRDSRNLKLNERGYNYICLLRDKFIFSQFLKSLKISTPGNIAIIDREEIVLLDNMESHSLEYLINNEELEIDGFCKKLDGISGMGAFPLRISKGKLFFDESEISIDQFKKKILEGKYLLQALIPQHPSMAKLHPSSVNTIRVITFNNKGIVTPFCAALRIGTGGRNVDNRSSGGIVVRIDLETGKLAKHGLFKPGYGSRVVKHPDTSIKFKGFDVPYFKEGVELSCRLHKYLYGIHSVGWDIAISPEGPLIIEGNDNWGGGLPMSIEKHFKSRFLDFF